MNGTSLRILYIAKHNNRRSNDDEGAILYALEQLGHTVIAVPEARQRYGRWGALDGADPACDLLLIHHWGFSDRLVEFPMPKVFWYFDLVEYPDETLEARNNHRRTWMRNTIPLVNLGFCTDGDWVKKDTTGKLIRLTQGFDTRHRGIDLPCGEVPPILFTGISKGGGRGRIMFVEQMTRAFGARFNHVTNGIHGVALAGLIAKSQVVVAPDSPVTDNYWSNRVYLTTGFGGLLIHPWSAGLAEQYRPDIDLPFYHTRDELFAKIEYFLSHPKEREELRRAGQRRTLEQHTYKHRAEQLINVCRDRLAI